MSLLEYKSGRLCRLTDSYVQSAHAQTSRSIDWRLTTDNIGFGSKGVGIPTRQLFLARGSSIFAFVTTWAVKEAVTTAATHSVEVGVCIGTFVIGLKVGGEGAKRAF